MPLPPTVAPAPELPRLDLDAAHALRAALWRARADLDRLRRDGADRRQRLDGWVGAHRRRHDAEHATLDAVAADLDDALRHLDRRASVAVQDVLDQRRALLAVSGPS